MPGRAASVEDQVPRGKQLTQAQRASPAEQVSPAQQVTPRVAVTADASACFALLGPATRERLLMLLDQLAELAELVPPSSPAWDPQRQSTGALGLEFGPVALRYRIDESDASLVIEHVALRPGHPASAT